MHHSSFKILIVLTFLFSATIYGQKNYSEQIQHYLEKNRSSLNLDSEDFSDLFIYDQYYSKSMELEHVYAVQKINDISVFNGIGNFAIKNGEVLYFGNNFESHIANRINTAQPKLTPIEAIVAAADQLGLNPTETPQILSAKSGQEFLLSPSGISQSEIPARLVYQPISKESLRLAWDMEIHVNDGSHWWSLRVDAVTGKIIDQHDMIIRCNFDQVSTSTKSVRPQPQSENMTFGRAPVSFLGNGSQYKVYPLPIESPIHGNRSVVSEPADPLASPYGWHDTDGAVGNEYTITRGNNVWAFEDTDFSFTPGNSPDGGPTLDFIYPLNLNQNPSNYMDAAITNLFYMNNMMHDIWYQYGFDEAAGNFQETNYTAAGLGADYVVAFAQAGSAMGPGNNALFVPQPDGTNSFMVMFTWNASGDPQVMSITAPVELTGSYTGTVATFGAPIPITGITGDFALVEDDNSSGTSTDSNDGCDVITNGSDLIGKIAVVRRGNCTFDTQVLNAQNEGAIAVVVVNNQKGLTTMSGVNAAISIPSILISKIAGEPLIDSLANGSLVNGTLKESGPFIKDGDLDNGIMAHEYGHGISNRLTGGPSVVNCLQNAEEMGEGWSDFFGLVLTMHPGDQATDARGYGTYVIGQQTTGTGIRQYPYTTDMNVNPFTYADVQYQFGYDNQGQIVPLVHGVGSIWATILWDLNWALIDKYGFDPDVYNGTGGNNIAMQLIIDGLKLQPCSPGFVDGRDAILAADMANNAGANQCLIWEVFANRGVGISASQGSSNNIFDQTPAFDLPLSCLAGNKDFKENPIQIYPNPTHGFVNIVSNVQGEIEINLFDINGRKVLHKKLNLANENKLNVSELSAGIYIIQLITAEKTQTGKLIVQ